MSATASAVQQYKSFNQTEDIGTLWKIYSNNFNPAIKEKLLVAIAPLGLYRSLQRRLYRRGGRRVRFHLVDRLDRLDFRTLFHPRDL